MYKAGKVLIRTALTSSLLAFCFSSVAIPQTEVAEPDERLVSKSAKYGFYVTDGKNGLISEITNKDLVVKVNGKPTQAFVINTSETPLLTLLAVDNSGSMRTELGDIIAVAKSIVDSASDGELTGVIRFISSDKIELVTGFTSDKTRLFRGLDGLYIEGGSTALVDAIYTGVEAVDAQGKSSTGLRQTIIVVSDGEERGSFYKAEQLLNLLKVKNVRVVFVGLLNGLGKKKGKQSTELIDLIVNASGGFAVYPKNIADFSGNAPSVLPALREQRYLEIQGPTEGAEIEIGLSKEFSKKDYKIYFRKLNE